MAEKIQQIPLIGYEQIQQWIREWDLKAKIRQKTQMWGLSLSSQTINQMPIRFIQTGIVLFFIHKFPQVVKQCCQQLKQKHILQLKIIYNDLCLKLFKKQKKFELSLLLMAKLNMLFLTSHVPSLSLKCKESDIYVFTIDILLGFKIDSKAYDVILFKNQAKNGKKRKKISIEKTDIINLIMQDNVFQCKSTKSMKRIRRVGFHKQLRIQQFDKDLEQFRLDIRQALSVDRNENVVVPVQKKKKSIKKTQPQLQHQNHHKQDTTRLRAKHLNKKQVSPAHILHESLNQKPKSIDSSKVSQQVRRDSLKIAKSSQKSEWKHLVQTINSRYKQNYATQTKRIPRKSYEKLINKSKINHLFMSEQNSYRIEEPTNKLSYRNEQPTYKQKYRNVFTDINQKVTNKNKQKPSFQKSQHLAVRLDLQDSKCVSFITLPKISKK